MEVKKRIPISNIYDATDVSQTVTLYLDPPSKFGPEISFLGKPRWTLAVSINNSAMVKDLLDRAEKAYSPSSTTNRVTAEATAIFAAAGSASECSADVLAVRRTGNVETSRRRGDCRSP